MSSPFKYHKSKILVDHHSYVSWTNEARKFVYSYILLDVLFAVIKCNEVGLGVKLNSGEVDAMWIDIDSWAQDKSKNYSHYVQEMYVIDGVLFKDDHKALEFHDWLEKRYMWETLSA